MALAPLHSAGILAVVALAALLWHDPHEPIEIAASFLVFKNLPVDRFVADAADALLTPPAQDRWPARPVMEE